MVYVFVFLGEFGYELFNWQGLVRNFKSKCNDTDKIVIGGRNGMRIYYPYADVFIDISENPLFKMSRACCYWAELHENTFVKEFLDEMKASLRSQIEEELSSLGGDYEKSSVNFIFSSDINFVKGIYFGPWQEIFSIYGGEGYKQNSFVKIEYDSEELKKQIEEKLNMDLSEPYVLIQSRKRDVVIRSQYVVPIDRLIKKLSEKITVVILNFDTGRAHDSKSEIEETGNCRSIKISSSEEQAILIKYADECIFSTENDFGSHIYVPPFMGKDVLAVAAEDIYKIGTTPIEFWNDEIFKFGGKIITFVAEQIFESEKSLNAFCEYAVKRLAAKNFFENAEEKSKDVKFEDFYLWPNTPPPPGDHQEKIIQRVGVSDRNVDDPKSRTHSLIKFISYLIQKDCLPYPFVLADICGGDAIVASKLKEHFSFSEIIAQDCFKDKFETHKRAGEVGVKLYGGYLQHIVEENLKFSKLDIVMMLNTFRGWESAQLRAHEQNLPAQTLEWFERNSRYIIVTATKEQIDFLKNSGRNVEVFAHGEDNSYFICIY